LPRLSAADFLFIIIRRPIERRAPSGRRYRYSLVLKSLRYKFLDALRLAESVPETDESSRMFTP